MRDTETELERVFRAMGEPSWWVLAALAANPDGLAPFQIVRYVEQALRSAKYPIIRLDPGTLHYALPRMEDLGVIEPAGERDVEVPIGHGAVRREKRPVWIISGLGERALATRDRARRALSRQKLEPGRLAV